MEHVREKKAFICDMDGVIYHGNHLLPGVKAFVSWLQREQKKFLFLTNSSERSPKELHQKLARLGLDVSAEHFYTSALATDTDIVAGIESEIQTILVRSGVTTTEDQINRYAYRPSLVLEGVGDICPISDRKT